MKKKPRQLSQLLRNKVLSALILCALVSQSTCVFEACAGELSSETEPIDLTPSDESLDLSSYDTISMSFDGALLKDVLLLFSQQSGLNFVASQEVESKKVTVYFENVSPKDALDSIISANGLIYSKKPGSDIYVVTPASKVQTTTLATKVIQLKFMRLSSSPLDVGGQVTISDLTKSSAPSSSETGAGGSPGSGGTSDRGADKIVQKLLTPAGKLTMHTHTNSLIITDTPDSIKQIEKVLSELDVPPSQVVLEVHIMEVSKVMASDIGISWGGANGAIVSLSGGARTTSFPFNTGGVFGGKQHLGVGQYIGDLTADSAEGTLGVDSGDPTSAQTLYGLVNAQNLAATLHYIESDSKTKVLARPRVLTQNNEAATIKLVTNAAIGVNAVTSGGVDGNTTEEAERTDIGVAMRLTPQINSDDTVLLFLEPAISTIAASEFVDGKADATTRLVRTMARIKDNQTLVIGGLISGQGTTSKRKVPIMGDIPWIGRAFRYDGDDSIDRELLIFVTPHIVRGSSSLGARSATAQGEDLSVKRVLSEFMDKEMDSFTNNFEASRSDQDNFFTNDQEFIQASERKSVNPAVEQQMTHALDSLGPQIVDQRIDQAMDALSALSASLKKRN